AEILTEVRIPLRPGGSNAFEKVGRRAGDWAVVSCGAAVWLDTRADGRSASSRAMVIEDARVGRAAVVPNTTGLPEISPALRGRPPSVQLYAEAGAIAARSCSPSADQRGSIDYKRHLAGELTRRALQRAVARVAPVE